MVKNRPAASILVSVAIFLAGALTVVLWVTMAGAGGATHEQAGPGSGSPGPGPMKMPSAQVRVGYVQSQQLQQRVVLIGRLREVQRAIIAAEVEGKVLSVPVQEGDPVVGGKTVLAEIDGVWANLDLARTQAQVAAAQATLDQSVLDLAYLEQLLDAQSAKPKEVQDMRAQVASDRARLSAEIAERDRVEKEVERLVVLAPFDGFVTRKVTEVGQWVERGDAIVEVISHGGIDAVADVPEHLIDQVKVGDRAGVVIEPLELAVRGEVAAINPSGNNSARTYPVKVRLDDQSGRLKAGMSVTVLLPIGPVSDSLTVPRDAVVNAPDGQTVWVGIPDDPLPTARLTAVRVLFSEGDRVVIQPLADTDSAGLTQGAAVVIEGAERLAPDQPLIYTNP